MPLINSKDFKALILAGGYATRLYPITLDISKPLLKINKKTIIDFSIAELNKIKELKEVAVVTNDKFYRDYCKWVNKLKINKEINIVNDGTKSEESKLGAVGDIYYAVKNRKIDSDLLVVGGDNIWEIGLTDFVKFAQSKGHSISIGIYNLKRKSKASRYGVVKVNKEHKILEFQEKPLKPASSFIAMCLYYFPRESLVFLKEYLKEPKFNADKAGCYIKWLLTKTDVYGFSFKGVWLDIGELDTYKQAQKYFSN